MQKSGTRPLLVHVTNTPTPYRTVFCNTLCEELNACGYDLHVLYCAEREPNRQWQVPFDDMVYPYEVLPGISLKVGDLNVHFNPTVITRLRQLRPKFLLVAGSWNMPTALLAASRILCGPAIRVFWSEGHADAVLNSTGPVAWLRRHSLRAYNVFAVPNEASTQFLRHELGFRPPILALPNTVDNEFYSQTRLLDRLRVREELNLPLAATIFVSVARLDESKGIRELVQAMSFLDNHPTPCMLVLIGDGRLKAELEAISRDSLADIRIIGHQDAIGVRNWMAAANAFVLASKRDPNPLSVIEAAFAGLPLLISHKAGNVHELVKEGESGMVIPSIDSRTIAAVLNQFCALSFDEREHLARGAAELAGSNFRRNEVVRNFVDALQNFQNLL